MNPLDALIARFGAYIAALETALQEARNAMASKDAEIAELRKSDADKGTRAPAAPE